MLSHDNEDNDDDGGDDDNRRHGERNQSPPQKDLAPPGEIGRRMDGYSGAGGPGHAGGHRSVRRLGIFS